MSVDTCLSTWGPQCSGSPSYTPVPLQRPISKQRHSHRTRTCFGEDAIQTTDPILERKKPRLRESRKFPRVRAVSQWPHLDPAEPRPPPTRRLQGRSREAPECICRAVVTPVRKAGVCPVCSSSHASGAPSPASCFHVCHPQRHPRGSFALLSVQVRGWGSVCRPQ